MIFREKDHNSNFLLIDWDILTICQYKCPYCYARKSYGKKWGRILSKKEIDLFLDDISKAKYDVILGILGGEPTLSPYLNYIIDKVQDIKRIIRLEIYTNGEKDLSTFHINQKVNFLLSYHCTETDGEKLLKNALYCSKNNIIFSIMPLMIQTKNSYKKIMNFINRAKSLGFQDSIEVQYVQQSDKSKQVKKVYINPKLEIQEENKKKFILGDKLYSYREIVDNKLNKFTGWRCYNDRMYVQTDFLIKMRLGNYAQWKPGYFENYKKGYNICTREYCVDEADMCNLKVSE